MTSFSVLSRLSFWCLGLVACGPDVLEARDPTPGVPHFKVATYNVLSTMHRDEATIAAVGATGADVVCLQEVTPEWQDVLVERYSEHYPYMLFEAHSGASGLGVLSRFPLSGGDLLFVRDWHPAWRVHAETPAGWLELLVVHLRAKFDVRGYDNVASSYVNWSEDHVLQTQAYLDGSLEDAPALILGDFNEGPDDGAVEYLEAIGYRNVLPLYRPGQYTWRHRSLGDQADDTIDHILFNRYLTPLDAFVLVKGNSDHLPVVAHFEAGGSWPALERVASESEAR